MQLPARIGKYELVEFLGGGMSHVYRATDTVLGRTVALKILTEAGCADEAAKARFLAEARMAGNIRHENIIGIHDFGEEQGRPFIVMEFLRGESLKDAIKNGRPPDLSGKLLIARQVAHALEYIHSLKIIHRDIKPDNIHIDSSGKVTLMDFGVSKREGLELTKAGFTFGTPYYMAPEQVLGQQVTHLVDVYAFGVVLYELLAGVKPITADSVERIFHWILYEPVDWAPLEKAGVPEPIRTLIARCTEKDAANRIQNFTLISAEIEKLLEKVPGTAAASPAMEAPAAVALRPAPWKFIWVSVAAAAVVAGAVFLLPRFLLAKGPGPSPWLLAVLALAAGSILFGAHRHRRSAMPVAPRRTPRPVAQPQPSQPPVERYPRTTPPLAEPPAGAAGEFTRMFRTEAPPPQPPALRRPKTTPPLPEAPEAAGGEFTRMFSVAREKPAGPAPDISAGVPDVALTITKCTNQSLVGRVFKLHRFPFRIVRSDGDLELPFDPAVSRQHAEVNFVDDGFTVCDLGSSNGTFVNGKRLKPREPEPLLFGATILIGSNTQLTFVSNDLEEIPDLTGKMVGGRYTLSQKLSSSARSVVYRASDSNLPQSVLVKILSPRLARHPGYREQFELEANIACRMRHPNIVRVLDHGEFNMGGGETGRSLYVSMEYQEGGSLAQLFAKEERFELERVAGWLERITQGLDYVHQQGLIHGGIKPSSIVFDSQGNAYLTDFAIATAAGDKSSRTVIGLPAFLAPEQWEGGEVVPATDQYALAVLFYLILTGTLPHEGQEHPEVRKRNLIRGPLPANEMAAQNGRPAVPPAVSPVLKRAMATKPEERFPSVLEFSRAFRKALTEKTGSRRPAVFLSYNRAASSAWALLFKNELEREHGCEVFVDTEQRDTVGQFPQKLERQIERCEVFICLLAGSTLESAWVIREVELAHSYQKPMIPVFQESFQFPSDPAVFPRHVQELLLFDGVKLLDRQSIYVNAAIKSVGDAVRQLVSG